ncbi:MAG: M23 family metallopeptidase [Sphingobacteriaceae bacterium]|nr:M23 family metallopeptidase [Sphingobacteriaceae bacterium]
MSEVKPSRWKKFVSGLKSRYRLVILNDTTYGEKLSIRLTPLGIIIGITAITILMTTLVISLVAFTSLKEYIPGYGNIAERKKILELTFKTDSIEQSLQDKEAYMMNILNVLHDSLERKSPKPLKDTSGRFKNVNVEPGKSDKLFREDYEQNKSSIASFSNPKLKGISELVFFTPVKGIIVSAFNVKEEHFGLDLVTKEDETVKNVLDGTVVFTGFSAEDGYVIHVQHSNNLTSIYKHNNNLLKKTGDRIKAGDVISIVGNTGELSKGPHLHLELWYNGIPIDPQDCIAF